MDYNEMLEILRGKVLYESAEATQQRLNEIADAMERLVRERDAVMDYIKNYEVCGACKHSDEPLTYSPCQSCRYGTGEADNWEWRGVQE